MPCRRQMSAPLPETGPRVVRGGWKLRAVPRGEWYPPRGDPGAVLEQVYSAGLDSAAGFGQHPGSNSGCPIVK